MPDPGLIYRVVERHRRELLRNERQAASAMVRAYGESWQRVKRDLDALTKRIAELRQAGEDVPPAWLFREYRLERLQDQVLAEMARFVDYAEREVLAQQQGAVEAASLHSNEVVRVAAEQAGVTASFTRLNPGAVEAMVGFSESGPLRDLFEDMGSDVSAGFRKALVNGVALGHNPRQIAREVRKEYSVGLDRALRISRTEALRSYREATRRNYQENEDILDGWRWLAALQARTCAMCLAMDGTVHPLSERLNDHPNGRCAMVPVVKGIGVSGRQTGAEWFAKQDEQTQRKVLGHAGYEAFKAGQVTLGDFIGQKRSKNWGTTRYARSLKDILGAEEAKKWAGVAMVALAVQQGDVNTMIKRLISSNATPTTEQVKQIAEHVARAEFASRRVNVDKKLRGREFQGRILGSKESSLITHLAKRTLIEQQWTIDITPEEYLSDLRQAVMHEEARLSCYVGEDKRRFVGILSPNDLPVEHMGEAPERLVFVLFSADHGTITSGYQVSGADALNIPEGTKWFGRK